MLLSIIDHRSFRTLCISGIIYRVGIASFDLIHHDATTSTTMIRGDFTGCLKTRGRHTVSYSRRGCSQNSDIFRWSNTIDELFVLSQMRRTATFYTCCSNTNDEVVIFLSRVNFVSTYAYFNREKSKVDRK